MGKPHPSFCALVLAEVLLKVGGVGHGEAGAVDVEGAVAAPQVIVLRRSGPGLSVAARCLCRTCLRRQFLADAAGQALDHFQRQSLACLAVSRRGELPGWVLRPNAFAAPIGGGGNVPNLGAGDVAAGHLLQEQADGAGGVQRPLTPVMPGGGAGAVDALLPQCFQRLVLDRVQRGEDTAAHPWPPVFDVALTTPSSQVAASGANVVSSVKARSYGLA